MNIFSASGRTTVVACTTRNGRNPFCNLIRQKNYSSVKLAKINLGSNGEKCIHGVIDFVFAQVSLVCGFLFFCSVEVILTYLFAGTIAAKLVSVPTGHHTSSIMRG